MERDRIFVHDEVDLEALYAEMARIHEPFQCDGRASFFGEFLTLYLAGVIQERARFDARDPVAEKARMRAILDHIEAFGRRDCAIALACDSDLSVADAISMLQTFPRAAEMHGFIGDAPNSANLSFRQIVRRPRPRRTHKENA